MYPVGFLASGPAILMMFAFPVEPGRVARRKTSSSARADDIITTLNLMRRFCGCPALGV
jgi:hypothetical protein